ncbi:hypothetical protein EDB80DRAFT_691212 [Ilyonectria destructans]|nr:hypothetical protein EDB80DRAFT_691212 [Ilyonectria destructans]
MQLKPGDLVLKFDVRRTHDLTTRAKMRPRWQGPYRISSQSPVSRAYRLETLDGIVFDRPTQGDYLKKFVEDRLGWWFSSSDLVQEGEEDDESSDQTDSDDGDSNDSWHPSSDSEGETAPLKATGEAPTRDRSQRLEVHLPYIPKDFRAQFRDLED